ncbi:toxin-antitoxin system TumE family protein [Halorientalis halophila]|uniref:toxin-antitoxin system TumE family protein n=1 Tax=Halorientalis halophila TaxID=3108499 RepID=UPI003009116C
MGRDEATLVIDVTKDFGDRFAEVRAWRVPESERYPKGIKYSMQYGNAAGETIVRYDNFPDHPDAARHHKHTASGTVEDVEFEGVRDLFARFKTEVQRHGDDWD